MFRSGIYLNLSREAIKIPGATGFSFLGIGEESTKGTAVAASHYIPVTSMDGTTTVDVLIDAGMRASMATEYGAVAGVKAGSFSFEGDVFPVTVGFPIAGIMGGYAVTGAGPYTHTFSLLNTGDGQCQPFTLWDYNGLQARKYPGATCSSFSLRVAAQELVTYSSSWLTFPSATDTTPTPSFDTHTPMVGWNCSASLGGSGNTLIEELDLSFSRNVTPIYTVDGNQNPTHLWQGPLSVSGRMMLIADAETEYTSYLAATIKALTFTLTSGAHSLAVTMTTIVATNCVVERGDDYTQISCDFTALANTTDDGASGGFAPVKIVLINDYAGTAYD